MTLHPQVAFVIPTETIRIAQAAFPQPSISMRMRDQLGPIDSDQSFAPLFAVVANQPSHRHGWRL